MLSVRDCIFLKPGTTSTNRMVMSTSKNATATPVAADQARFLFIILVIAQAAIIGAFTLACKPIAITICTCDMSLVERVMRLAVENLPISSIENEITLSYTASLSLLDRPAATTATKYPTINVAAILKRAQPSIFIPTTNTSPSALSGVCISLVISDI